MGFDGLVVGTDDEDEWEETGKLCEKGVQVLGVILGVGWRR